MRRRVVPEAFRRRRGRAFRAKRGFPTVTPGSWTLDRMGRRGSIPSAKVRSNQEGLMRKLALAVSLVIASLGLAASASAAGVDPNTLQPVPPNATCHDAGQQIVCDTFLAEFLVNAPNPDLELPCGRGYETSYYRGDGTRWYVNRLLVTRHVAASLVGTFSLSPTGAGPTVNIGAHSSNWSTWTTPGDDSARVATSSSGSHFK